jgi:formylglycine-generating enzyme required for sulfatase activity
MAHLRAPCIALLFALCAACSPPHLLVLVDTDAPVLGQLAGRPELPPDAAIDTLRVDILDEADHLLELCEINASETSAWPVSFGVRVPEGVRSARLRLRAFQRAFARGLSGEPPRTPRSCGAATIPGQLVLTDPPPEVTIDRVVELPLPSEGTARIGVILAFECLGTPTDFLRRTSCVGRDRLREPLGSAAGTVPAHALAVPSLRVGTASAAQEVPCPPGLALPPDRVCVPGGFSIQGDRALAGLEALDARYEPVPLRAVHVAPFVMDRLEFSVGRLRALAAPPEPPLRSPPLTRGTRQLLAGSLCTWPANLSSDALDEMPANCISWQGAREACERVHGLLPTESQWEHAARGRGQGRTYPWGDGAPTCCQAALYHRADEGLGCPGRGPSAVGVHDGGDCEAGGDVSRDGISDLGGNVQELVLDWMHPYAARCGLDPEGISRNPQCRDEKRAIGRLARGGDFNAALAGGKAAWRLEGDLPWPALGFRCVYEVPAR